MIIYKVVNKINGKCYIGQTVKSLRVRISGHYACAKRDNYHFHNALLKYNKKDFDWSVLCECDTKDELNEMEYRYIKQYDTYNNGYNTTYGGDGNNGLVHTDEWKQHMSTNNPMHNPEIVQRVKDTIKENGHHHQGKKWEDIRGDRTEWDKRNQSDMMSTNNPMFNPEVVERMKQTKIDRGSYHTEACKEGRKIAAEKTAKEWIITTPEGETMTISNLNSYCKENNLHNSCMINVANGSRKQHKGYKCVRK
jgi:group I intron endonuclease